MAYSDSASGVYVGRTLYARLGIAAQTKDKSRMTPAEPVAAVVARGAADMGVVDDLALLRLLKTWAPDDATRNAILVSNPAALFGFRA